jgi:hypothetical protein
LHYLVTLLRHPEREIHVTEMVRLATGGEPRPQVPRARAEAESRIDLGDAGPLLDARSTAEYVRRLKDLREDLAEAEELNDLGRAESLRAEAEFLAAELSAAGRGKRSASHGERARTTVTKAIKTALERIAQAHPVLGRHLRATIKRGYFCSYTPDPRYPVRWET